jgi:hypothetical protein
MLSNRDATARKLSDLFKESKRTQEISAGVFETNVLRPAGLTFDQFQGLLGDFAFELIAKSVFQLDPKRQEDVPLLAAFAAAGLDQRNPEHWRELVSLFAKAHFEETPRGAPEKWGPLEYAWLLRDIVSVLQLKPKSKHFATSISKILRTQKPFKEKYAKHSQDHVRRLIREARSPSINKMLRYPKMDNFILSLIRAEYEDRGVPWTPQFQSQVEAVLKALIETMSASGSSERPTTHPSL